jgi:hypothetical protein
MLIPLEIPPGVYRNGTDFQSSGRWRDSNLVRWRDGALQPIGGWRGFGDTTLNAAPRGAHSWVTKTGTRWVAFGTFSKLYVIAGDGTTSDITPTSFTTGREDAAINTGYGGGFYGRGTYGTPRPETGSFSVATVWKLDNWGEELVGCSPDDGKLVQWALSTGTPAATIPNAPTGCTSVLATEERFLFALGADSNDRLVQWSDREDNETWTPASTNEAGSLELQTAGRIVTGERVRGQALILTDTDAHAATYQGPPFVYGFQQVGNSCGIVAPAASAVLDGVAFWMGQEAFFTYAGGAVQQLPCEVADYVFSSINRDQISKAHAVTNSRYGEVWWFYPSASSTECDRYVSYDTTQGVWMLGAIDRTAAVDSGAARYPVWFDSAGDGYQHEVSSFTWGGAEVYAESGPISIGVGENTFTALELIPDEKTMADTQVTFKARYYPNGDESQYGPYTLSAPTDVLFTGRQMRLRVSGAEMADWRWGIPRVRVKPRGRK